MANLNSKTGAIISPDGRYRYLLWRNWDLSRPRLLWVMLNPSTADAKYDDATLRRCMDFTKRWGFGGLLVVNLFAYRTPYPHGLRAAINPAGRWNDRVVRIAAKRASAIVVAWGAHGVYWGRDDAVLNLLAQHAARPLLCLDVLRNGSPRHPLYVASCTPQKRYP